MSAGNGIASLTSYGMAVAGYAFRSSKAHNMPISMMLEPTNTCNLRCPLCATGSRSLTRPFGTMHLAEFERICEHLPRTVSTIYLWGQGEPFLAPDLNLMIHHAHLNGMKTIVSTNGHFLQNPMDIIESGLDVLIVSLDGADRDTYESYRSGGDFDTVVNGVKQLVREKKRRGYGPRIEFQHLVTRANEHHLGEFRSLAKECGADKVVFKTLQAASMDGGEEFIPENPRYSRYRRNQDGTLVPRLIPLMNKRCLRIYYSLQVDWQGNVLPCCFDKDSDKILGNLLNEPLTAIWNNERYRDFRTSMNRYGRKLPMCRDCTEGLWGITVNG